MQRTGYELEVAFVIIILLSGVYISYDLIAEPSGSHPIGQALGITGTLLMVMTETLYSLRKRTRLLDRFGPVRHWLSFHIVTGLVGPFLVLMHTGLQFRGLAGVTMALTVIVVISGFIGRYLYTALRRQNVSPTIQRLFAIWHTVHIPLGVALFTAVALHIAAAIFFRAGVFE